MWSLTCSFFALARKHTRWQGCSETCAHLNRSWILAFESQGTEFKLLNPGTPINSRALPAEKVLFLSLDNNCLRLVLSNSIAPSLSYFHSDAWAWIFSFLRFRWSHHHHSFYYSSSNRLLLLPVMPLPLNLYTLWGKNSSGSLYMWLNWFVMCRRPVRIDGCYLTVEPNLIAETSRCFFLLLVTLM